MQMLIPRSQIFKSSTFEDTNSRQTTVPASVVCFGCRLRLIVFCTSYPNTQYRALLCVGRSIGCPGEYRKLGRGSLLVQ